MKKYDVTLIETIKYNVTVEADSWAGARELVELSKSAFMKKADREFVGARIKSVNEHFDWKQHVYPLDGNLFFPNSGK